MLGKRPKMLHGLVEGRLMLSQESLVLQWALQPRPQENHHRRLAGWQETRRRMQEAHA